VQLERKRNTQRKALLPELRSWRVTDECHIVIRFGKEIFRITVPNELRIFASGLAEVRPDGDAGMSPAPGLNGSGRLFDPRVG
jgi:hypothetical protein